MSEKTRLANFPGTTYPTGVFYTKVGNIDEMINSFDALEKVSPSEISSDVANIKTMYEGVKADPTKLQAAVLSIYSTDNNVRNWTSANCDVKY